MIVYPCASPNIIQVALVPFLGSMGLVALIGGAFFARVQESLRALFLFSSSAQGGIIFIALSADTFVTKGLRSFGVALSVYTLHFGLLGAELFSSNKEKIQSVRSLGIEMYISGFSKESFARVQFLMLRISGLPGTPLFFVKLIVAYTFFLKIGVVPVLFFLLAAVSSVAYY